MIATNVRGLLDSYQYPESFCSPTDEMLSFEFGAEGLAVRLDRFLSVVHLLVENIEGHPILEKELPAPVAEVILRALLLGRRRFAVPTDPKIAKNCVDKFFPWIEAVQGRSTTVGGIQHLGRSSRSVFTGQSTPNCRYTTSA